MLGPGGVRVERLGARRFVRWEDIRAVDPRKHSMPMELKSIDAVALLDANEKVLATITDSVDRFDDLSAALIARSSEISQRATLDMEATEERRTARDARNIRWAAWGFVAFTVAMAAAFAYGVYEELHLRRFATESVEVEAKVLRAWKVKVTPRVEYAFQDADGHTHTREAMMYVGPAWQAAQQSETIPVEYLPSNPEWNRLVSGEDWGTTFGGFFLLISGFGTLMFGSLSVVALLGFELGTENGVTTLKRHGRILKVWSAQQGQDGG